MTKSTCSIDGCERQTKTRGWCAKHYTAWKRHGDPLVNKARKHWGCSADACDREHYARGWCTKHYKNWLATGDPLGIGRRYERETCSRPGCDRSFYALELCCRHYARLRARGTTERADRRLPNRIDVAPEGHGRLTIVQRSGKGHVALFDLADHELVASRHWLMLCGYVARWSGSGRHERQAIGLHRDILGLTPGDGILVDHRDGDPLNNCRANLRRATYAINGQNIPIINNRGASKYRGVRWDSRRKLWTGHVIAWGEDHTVGTFHDEDEAAAAVRQFRRAHGVQAGH